ncbi:MAG: DNA polymerase III subunit delta [Deltaproteobacteria bacterium]|nr:DNA polymerase III subunit delta [Deltaproteobacteria bacterium]
MGRMDPKAFESEIASPQRKPFYLITGGDPSAVGRCLGATRAAVSQELIQLNYRQYGLEGLDNASGWARLTQEVTTNPFGKPPRIVVVTLTEAEKLKAEHYAIIGKIRPKIARSATLALVLMGGFDSRLKFFRELSQAGVMVDCQAPNRYNLHNWVIAKFKEKGLRAGLEAARLMIERAGPNLGVLLSEIEKLSVYPGPDVVITTEHVRLYVSLGASAEVYDLGTPLGLGRLEKAVPIMMDLLDKSDPVTLINVIATHFRHLFHMKVIIEASGGHAADEALAAEMGVNTFRIRFFREQIGFWTLSSLGEAHSAIQDSLRSVLTGMAPDKVALGALAVKLAGLARARDGYAAQANGPGE